MTDFSRLQSILAANFVGRVTNLGVRRGNELHVQLARGAAAPLAQLLRADFNTELILMVAADHRADKSKAVARVGVVFAFR